jgi:hypothetical protein
MAVFVVSAAAWGGGGGNGVPSGAPKAANVFSDQWPASNCDYANMRAPTGSDIEGGSHRPPARAAGAAAARRRQMKDGCRRSSIQSASDASPTTGSTASHTNWP